MVRIRLGGPQSAINRSVKELASFGALHISNTQNDKYFADTGLKIGMMRDGIIKKLQLAESLLYETRTAQSLIRSTSASKKEKTKLAPVVEDWSNQEKLDETGKFLHEIKSNAEKRQSLIDELREVRQYIRFFEKFQPLVESVKWLKEIDVFGLFFEKKTPETEERVDEIENRLNRTTGGAYSIIYSTDELKSISCLVIYPSSMRENVRKNVFGGRTIPLHVSEKYEKESFGSTLLHLYKKEKEVKAEMRNAIKLSKAKADEINKRLSFTEKSLKNLINELKVQNYLALSKSTFWITGWLPEYELSRLKEFSRNSTQGVITLNHEKPSVEEYPSVPVQLENNAYSKPFERLLTFFPPPVFGSIDPTVLISLTFPIFFGFMLGDIGYGLIMLTIGYAVLKADQSSIVYSDISKMIFTCSISAILFGILYGEFFGKIWFNLGLPPPMFDRMHEIIFFLSIAFILGGLHILIGNVFALSLSFKGRDKKRTLKNSADITIVIFSYVAAGMVVTEYSPMIPLIFIGIALSIKLAVGGFLELLETFRLVSNLLSYSRLMAIGIASVVLADMADDLIFTSEIIWVGITASILVHLLNLVLGIFSPTIHALRLHYVEFFSQFYQQGLIRYTPFKETTKT